jgi:uncharacterized protein (DUF58 family)
MRFALRLLGWQYVGLTFLITAAALNTSNNTLYMVAALMLGLFILSGILSDLTLWQVELEAVEPGEFYARQPGALWVRLKNRNRFFGAYGLTVNQQPYPVVPRGTTREAPVQASFPSRGYAPVPKLWVESCFPFGFLARRRALSWPGNVLVYPSVLSRRPPDTRVRRRMGERERSTARGELLEYRSLKPFQEGDDPRHISWKKSAQRSELIVMEFDRRSRGGYELFLDTRTADTRRFEESVDAAAAAAFRLLRQGHSVSVSTPDTSVSAGSGEGQRRHLLSFLALVRPSP